MEYVRELAPRICEACMAVVNRCPDPRLWSTRPLHTLDDGQFKYGIHLNCPDFPVTKEIAHAIRLVLLEMLLGLGCSIKNEDWENVLDKSIYGSNGLRMYGCQNSKNTGIYTLIAINEDERREEGIDKVRLVKDLSIRCWDSPFPANEDIMKEYEAEVKELMGKKKNKPARRVEHADPARRAEDAEPLHGVETKDVIELMKKHPEYEFEKYIEELGIWQFRRVSAAPCFVCKLPENDNMHENIGAYVVKGNDGRYYIGCYSKAFEKERKTICLGAPILIRDEEIEHGTHFDYDWIIKACSNAPYIGKNRPLGPSELEDFVIKYMNRWFSCINGYSKVQIMEEYNNEYTGKSVRDCNEMLKGKKVYWKIKKREEEEVTYTPKSKDLFTYWYEHKNRRTLRKITFDPTPSINWEEKGYLNTFMGLKITREIAQEYSDVDIQPFLDHIRCILCKNDEESYNYLIGWMALTVQTPHVKKNVSIVLSGVQGAGKTVVIEKFGDIFGDYYHEVKGLEEIMGDFTYHALNEKLVLYLNEITWGKDHRTTNRVRSLITSKYLRIRNLYCPAITLPSYVSFIIDGNADSLVALEGKERRFAVLETDNRYAGIEEKESYKHFKPVYDTPPEAFANYLYNYDISEFSDRKIPITEGIIHQKVESFTPIQSWLFECINDEVIGTYDIDEVYTFEEDIPKSAVYRSYESSLKGPRAENNSVFWQRLRKLVSYKETHKRIGSRRDRCVKFPSIEQCKREMEKRMGELPWREEVEED